MKGMKTDDDMMKSHHAGVTASPAASPTEMPMKKMPMKKMPMKLPSVFPSHSSNLEEEVSRISDLLQLSPGSAYCEVGGGSGLLFAKLAPMVMPGGAVYGTGVSESEIHAMAKALNAAAPTVNASLYVAEKTASGLPAGSCDAIMLRMVYHMLGEATAYLADFYAALKPGGRLLMLEHDSDNGATGRQGAKLTVTMPSGMSMDMHVVPPPALLTESMGAGFEVVTDVLPMGIVEPWVYFNDPGHGIDERGYAVLLTKA